MRYLYCMRYFKYFFLICFLYLLPWPINADDDHERAKKLMESGEIIPLENILKNARNVHPGKIIKVELETEKNKILYEIEILDKQGTVWELKFDAYSGKLLKKEKED